MYQTETFDENWNGLSTYAFWNKVGEIQTLAENSKFGELVKLVKVCLSLSHGNAEPERGFSENKKILEGRGDLDEETIVAIRAVKSYVNFCGSPCEVVINRRLLELCALARQKYFAFLDIQKETQELTLKNKRIELEKRTSQKGRKSYADKVSEIDDSIQVENRKFESAEALIGDGNKVLVNAINSKGKVNKTELIKAQMLLHAGMEKVSESKTKMYALQIEKTSLISKKK